MVPTDLNIGFQGLALIQGHIYNPDPLKGCPNCLRYLLLEEKSPQESQSKSIEDGFVVIFKTSFLTFVCLVITLHVLYRLVSCFTANTEVSNSR